MLLPKSAAINPTVHAGAIIRSAKQEAQRASQCAVSRTDAKMATASAAFAHATT